MKKKSPEFMPAQNPPEVLLIRAADFFSPRLPFHVMRLVMRREDWKTPYLRRRDFWKVVCILDGKGQYITGSKLVPIEVGDFLLVGPDEATAYQVESPEMRILNLLFQPSWVEASVLGLRAVLPELFAPGKGVARQGHYPQSGRELQRLVFELEQERLHGVGVSETLLRLKLAELLLKLSRSRPRAKRAKQQAQVLDLIDGRLLSSFDEPFSLKSLAQEAKLHPNSLARIYRKARGRSLSSAWELRRVEKACEYLGSGDMSITRIAGEVGFNDLSFFYKIFKRYRGLAPGEWRQRQKSRS